MLHSIVVAAVVGVLGLGYWTTARADAEGGGSSDELEVVGVVDAFDDTSITVDGVLYSLTDETKVEGDLEIGATVEIEFVDNGDGTFTALEVENEDGGEDLDEDDGEDDGDDDADEDEDEDEDEEGDDDDEDDDEDEGDEDDDEDDGEDDED